MLKSKNLTNVLSQAVQPEKPGSTIISSILSTSMGRPVASSHNNRVPPLPHAATTGEPLGSDATPYQVDRAMKTNVYGLLASSAWEEYGNKAQDGTQWISIATTDALLVVRPVHLQKASQTLLLIIVADPLTALGVLEKKSQETAAVLEKGLSEFKIYD